MRRLREIGEKRLLKWIAGRLKMLEGASLPPGDDAADLLLRGRLIVSCDMMVEKTDMPPGMSLRSVGYKAVTAATSDVAAKGGRPLAYLVSLMLPADLRVDEFEELWRGLEEAADFYGGRIIGGDLNSGDQIVIDVICMGLGDRVIPRLGARPGDVVAVTGMFGAHAAGLHALLNGIRDDPLVEELITRFERPVARIEEAIALAESSAVTSSIDSSDGLAESLHLLAEANGVGFVIENPPVSAEAAEYSRRYGVNLLDLVFYGGEEYELVVTIKPGMLEEAFRAVERAGGNLIPIGRVTEGEGVKVKWFGREMAIERRGYEHFRSR